MILARKLPTILLLSCVLSACAVSPKNDLELFSAGNLAAWKEHVFAEPTKYSFVQEDGGYVLKAVSNGSASALYQKVSIDLEQTPYINWRWKVDAALQNSQEKKKSGDDYPVRVYVVVAAKPFRFKPRSLNYVWSSQIPVGQYWISPYSEEVVMVSLQSGQHLAGRWLQQKRNLKTDLKQYLGEDIRYIEGIAVMTDTDNSQSQAVAYYGDIYFSAE